MSEEKDDVRCRRRGKWSESLGQGLERTSREPTQEGESVRARSIIELWERVVNEEGQSTELRIEKPVEEQRSTS